MTALTLLDLDDLRHIAEAALTALESAEQTYIQARAAYRSTLQDESREQEYGGGMEGRNLAVAYLQKSAAHKVYESATRKYLTASRALSARDSPTQPGAMRLPSDMTS